jgi:hypothetical protein
MGKILTVIAIVLIASGFISGGIFGGIGAILLVLFFAMIIG